MDFAKEILPVNIEDELKQSYLSYAMSVIHGRALPDVRVFVLKRSMSSGFAGVQNLSLIHI